MGNVSNVRLAEPLPHCNPSGELPPLTPCNTPLWYNWEGYKGLQGYGTGDGPNNEKKPK